MVPQSASILCLAINQLAQKVPGATVLARKDRWNRADSLYLALPNGWHHRFGFENGDPFHSEVLSLLRINRLRELAQWAPKITLFHNFTCASS